MSALPYIPLYVADYLADTSHLSTIEHGAYLLLIMNYWQRGKALPAGDLHLSRIARMTMDEWLAAKPLISEFFVEVDGEWVNHRVETELQHVRNSSATKSRAGKASAEAKAQQKSSGAPTQRKQKINTRSTPVEQVFNNTDTDIDIIPPTPQKGGAGGDGFQEFWEVYPKRDGNADMDGAKLAYYGVIAENPPDTVLSAAVAYAAWCVENRKTGTPYVKSAKTWLDGGVWREWLPKAIATVPTGVLVKPGTPQWQAWQAVKKTPVSERYGGWWFPTEWPPGVAVKVQEVAA